MFGPLISDSTYFSDAKTTFEMFRMISFKVDSQTPILCIGRIITLFSLSLSLSLSAREPFARE
jgi:hypothetical protein